MKSYYSNLLKYLVLPIADNLMKTSIIKSYWVIKKMRSLTQEEIVQWQNENLNSLILHVYTNTKYYNDLFRKLCLSPEDIKTLQDLNKLPILTKKDIYNHFNELVPRNISNIPNKKSSTGGSSGDPMPYLLDNKSWSFSNANNIINWEKTSYSYGDKFIALGSTSLFVNKNPSLKHRIYYGLKNKIGLNGINMSEKVCREYVTLIKKVKIRFIYGYASSIYLLAKHVLKFNEKVDIRACFPTSEVLTDLFRETIQKAFQCDILDCYGGHDGGITAFSYIKGFFEVGYSCLLRLDNPDKNGQGPALLTDLFNYAMPLINYKLGDEILIDKSRNKDYPYNGQIINQVLGRTSDIIELENGNTLTGPGFTILFKDLPVEHYCIEKTGTNAIQCQIVKLPGYTQQHEDLVSSSFYKQMGAETQFSIDYTTEIPLTKSGKRLYFKG